MKEGEVEEGIMNEFQYSGLCKCVDDSVTYSYGYSPRIIMVREEGVHYILIMLIFKCPSDL